MKPVNIGKEKAATYYSIAVDMLFKPGGAVLLQARGAACETLVIVAAKLINLCKVTSSDGVGCKVESVYKIEQVTRQPTKEGETSRTRHVASLATTIKRTSNASVNIADDEEEEEEN